MIGKKKRNFTVAPAQVKAGEVPIYTADQLGLREDELLVLHDQKLRAKAATSRVKAQTGAGGTGKKLLDAVRSMMFEGGAKSAYVNLPDGKQLLVKTNTRLFPLDEMQAGLITEIIEGSGRNVHSEHVTPDHDRDAGDYYYEHEDLGINADAAFERLGEEKYERFVKEFKVLLARFEIGDLVLSDTVIMPRSDFMDKRMSLPPHVNMAIEGVKPTSMSIEARQTL
jgi:hypothetical protein